MSTRAVKEKMEPITAKLKPDEKREFLRVADRIGTTPSNAIRIFVAAFNRRGGFPFDPSNPLGYNRQTLAAMEDAALGRDLSGPYGSAREARAAILAEDENA
ncbi:MAG: type II toxin-antitoxin system RelB/DinJ family antitoxin [Bifidobacteriaceae bacterium]|nr:type II toxin-antitoxin system RelB/DinJ family antitoxin [Bifidobacteriaceae bacterium]